jgi:hypothetical protein
MLGNVDQLTPLIAIALIVFFVYRQFAVRRIRAWTLVALPLVALWGALNQLHDLPTAPTGVALAAAGLATAFATGVLRGAAMQVWRDAEGAIWARGSWALLALWVASFAVRAGLYLVARNLGSAAESQAEVLAFVAATLSAQNAVIWLRSLTAQPRLTTARGSDVA